MVCNVVVCNVNGGWRAGQWRSESLYSHPAGWATNGPDEVSGYDAGAVGRAAHEALSYDTGGRQGRAVSEMGRAGWDGIMRTIRDIIETKDEADRQQGQTGPTTTTTTRYKEADRDIRPQQPQQPQTATTAMTDRGSDHDWTDRR